MWITEYSVFLYVVRYLQYNVLFCPQATILFFSLQATVCVYCSFVISFLNPFAFLKKWIGFRTPFQKGLREQLIGMNSWIPRRTLSLIVNSRQISWKFPPNYLIPLGKGASISSGFCWGVLLLGLNGVLTVGFLLLWSFAIGFGWGLSETCVQKTKPWSLEKVLL